MSTDYIPLEKHVEALESKISELRLVAARQAINLDSEINELAEKADDARRNMCASLSPYEKAQLARHPRRPNTLELIASICEEFVELHGDRNFQDDQAIVGGLARVGEFRVMVVGHQKGRTTKEKIRRNFGMPKPEGYRKALRLMSMAERFKLPIISFVDTPGAYPGVGAEERGQSEAIAKNIMVMSKLKVPILSFVIGEGGSGGALAIAVANRIYMLEHSIYSVISPEGCASILFKDAAKAPLAAAALKLTAPDTLELNIIDGVLPEPLGGAHRSPETVAQTLRDKILQDLTELSNWSGDQLREHRIARFMAMGGLGDGTVISAR